MIELRDVTRTFAAGAGTRRRVVRALDAVDVDLPGGEVSAVVGPNGAGKTTLFALVLGFLRPTAGEVRIAGRPPRRWIRAEGAAYLPDRFTLPDGWTVRRGLLAFARLEGLPRGEAAARVGAAIDRFGLERHVDRPAGALSLGLLQRVGLAQAAVGRRSLLVLDEPAQGLDPLWRVRLRDWLSELRREGRTILLASHDLGEVERVADRVVLLEEGRVREVMRSGEGEAGARWRVVLEEPLPSFGDIFPGAAPGEDGAWVVTVDGPRELSERLSAAMAAGAVLVEASPLREPLESRVRRALEPEAGRREGTEDGPPPPPGGPAAEAREDS